MSEEINKKLDDIHSDVKDIKGEFHTMHDRMDREVTERSSMMQRIYQTIVDLETRIIAWWRASK